MMLEITEKQFVTLMRAAEYQNRMSMGQVSMPDTVRFKDWIDPEAAERWESEGRRIFFPELSPGASYGFAHDPESYELWREMAHQWALRNGYDNVYAYPTLHTSWQPLPKVLWRIPAGYAGTMSAIDSFHSDDGTPF